MTRQVHPQIRSLFFTPANNRRKMERVFDFGADAVNLDLEDAVLISEKPAARLLLRETLDKHAGAQKPRIVVRINAPSLGLVDDDLDAAVHPRLFAVQITKVQSLDEVRMVDERITKLEAARGIPAGSIKLISSIDSPFLVLNLADYVRSSKRFYCVIIGGADYAVSIGLRASPTQVESLWARSYGVLVCRDAGLAPPLHPCNFNLDNVAEYETLITSGKQLGFQGAIALHPKQVAVAQRVFSPTEEEVQQARELVREFKAMQEQGAGTLKTKSGEFIDYAIVAWAEEVLARVE
jgi:citrate lyase subunit beta/citryl-CoA lyase